jgi:hypothetical protein
MSQPDLPLVRGPLPPHDPATGELVFADAPAASSPPFSAPSRGEDVEEREAPRDAALAAPAGAVALSPRPSGFGGFSPRELVVMALFLVLLLWVAWATRELMTLKDRRTVSVSLATMVQDFVAAEARRGSNQQDAAARTKAYLTAIDAAMRAISEDGTTILVSEAVLGNSVPDVTQTVMKAVNSRLGIAPAAAGPATPAALLGDPPPSPLLGLPPSAPSAPVPDVSMSAPQGSGTPGTGNPFEASPQ